MINTTANMSALEWFFRNPPASNFPQNTSSPGLRQLNNAVEQLSIALNSQGAAPEFAELSEYTLFFAQWVGRIGAIERVERADVNSLVQKVDEVIKTVKKLDKPSDFQNIYESLNATVISLVILAKTSQDIEFRNKIISLAKGFASISPSTTEK